MSFRTGETSKSELDGGADTFHVNGVGRFIRFRGAIKMRYMPVRFIVASRHEV